MEQIEANIANLEAAMATGTREVTVDGKSVTYTSTKEIREAISYFRAQKARILNRPAVGVSIGAMYRG